MLPNAPGSIMEGAAEILNRVGLRAYYDFPGCLTVATLKGIVAIDDWQQGQYRAELYRGGNHLAEETGTPIPFEAPADADAEGLAAAVTSLVLRIAEEVNHKWA